MRELRSLTFFLPAHYGAQIHDAAWLTASACLRLIPPTAPLQSLHVFTLTPGVMLGFANLAAEKQVLQYFDDAACTLGHLRHFEVAPSNRMWDFGGLNFPANELLPNLCRKEKVKITVRTERT